MSRYFGLAAAALLSLAGTGGALAADMAMAVKAPPMVAGCAWCGFYVGGNAGYAWGRDTQDSVFTAPAPGVPADTAAVSAAGSPRLNTNGFTGGLQAGYNWQSGALLFGAEADINAFSLRGSTSNTLPFPSTLPGGAFGPPTLFFTANSSAGSDWLFTARNRIGWASDNLLIYGTGGLAVANVKINQTIVLLGGSETVAVNATQVGWTAGVGAEYMISRNWSVKGEWLYVDLGKVSAPGALTPGFAAGVTYNTTARLTANIARVGVNYHFGGPVVAKY